jgi:hypothetical protein
MLEGREVERETKQAALEGLAGLEWCRLLRASGVPRDTAVAQRSQPE